MIKKILGIAVLFGLMMTAAQAKTFLVDVRTPSEIATTGKVEGALVANYSAPDFVDQFKGNVEFVEILPDQSLRMRVWERGSGIKKDALFCAISCPTTTGTPAEACAHGAGMQ